MLLDDVGSASWDQEWRFEREESDKNVKTGSVYVVVAANALVAAALAAPLKDADKNKAGA